MAFSNFRSLFVGDLFMLFIVAVISVGKIPKLAQLVLEVMGLDLQAVQMGVLKLLSEMRKGMLNALFDLGKMWVLG